MLVNVSSSSDDSGETVRMLTDAISTKPIYHVLAHLIHNKGLLNEISKLFQLLSMVFIITNSVDNAFNYRASHLGRHCLLMFHLWDDRLKLVNMLLFFQLKNNCILFPHNNIHVYIVDRPLPLVSQHTISW